MDRRAFNHLGKQTDSVEPAGQAHRDDLSGGLECAQRRRPLIGDYIKRDFGCVSKEPGAAAAVMGAGGSTRHRVIRPAPLAPEMTGWMPDVPAL
jgi:hypothetical protein